MTRNRWLIVAALVAWTLLLLGLAVWSAQTGPATVREQSDLSQGRQALDRAVETLRTEAAGAGLAAEVEPYDVRTGCRLHLAWRGTEVDQVMLLAVPPGEEPEALAELAQRMPAGWNARFNSNIGRFSADAGDFVQVVGAPEAPGEVRITVSTGCRPGDDPVVAP